MITNLIRIGNSHGIRIPKTIIEQCGFESEVKLSVKDGELTVKPVRKPRDGWDEAFKKMAEESDDELLDDDISLTTWDDEEWD